MVRYLRDRCYRSCRRSRNSAGCKRPPGAAAAAFCTTFNVFLSFVLHFQVERPVQTAIATATSTFTLISLSASGLTSHTVADLRYCRSSISQDKASDPGKTPAASPQKAPYTCTVIFEPVVPFLRSTSKKRRPYKTSSSERLSQPTDIEEHIFAHCSSG